jgi:hypothetical protein
VVLGRRRRQGCCNMNDLLAQLRLEREGRQRGAAAGPAQPQAREPESELASPQQHRVATAAAGAAAEAAAEPALVAREPELGVPRDDEAEPEHARTSEKLAQ